MTAMTAASLDVLTGGRFRLGLGVSGPAGLRGLARRPLRQAAGPHPRVPRACSELALARRTVAHEGAHYPLPLPDGPGKALKLTIAPVSERIPIYLAAVGPRRTSSWPASSPTAGWPSSSPPTSPTSSSAAVAGRAGTASGGRWRASTWCPPSRWSSAPTRGPAPTPSAAVRGALPRRDGQPDAELLQRARRPDGLRARRPATVQDLYLDRRQRDAMAAVPYEFIDAHLAARRPRPDRRPAAGCSPRPASPPARSCPTATAVEEKLAALTVLAEAFERASVGSRRQPCGSGSSTPVSSSTATTARGRSGRPRTA